jgi:predicted nucleic acid-binding protein
VKLKPRDEHRFAIAEINDYETRRELLRKGATGQVVRLDRLIDTNEFLSLDRASIVAAAHIWAQLRGKGNPTAASDSIDCDVILGAQALERSKKAGAAEPVVVATGNVRHLARICTTPPCTAADWKTV